MKKNIVYLLSLLAVLVGVGIACNKNNLNVSPVSSVSDDAVFNSTDPGLLTSYVNDIYGGLPHGCDWSTLALSTDEAHDINEGWSGTGPIVQSQLTNSNLGGFSYNSNMPEYWHFDWQNEYAFIRATNLFFSKINTSPVDMATKNELKGEVFFQRAYLYHNLVCFYGGVPLITKAYTLTDSFSVARDTYANCIQFISDNCDSAAKYLPLVQGQVGRATKGAALTLKSRVLLYAASDLYNGGNSVVSDPFASYAHPELVRYTSFSASDRQARWQKAKDAAKAVIDLGIYSLYKPNPANGDEATANFDNLFLQSSTPEDIFIKYFTTSFKANWNSYGKTDANYSPTLFNSPNGFWGWGVNTPTQQFVDEFEMNDGSTFSWSNATEAAAPYANRDPRFYATVLYDGAYWHARSSDIAPFEPTGKIQTGYQTVDGSGTTVGGWDTKDNYTKVNTWNAGKTGYYQRKLLDPTVDPVKTMQSAPWRYMRYTEVLLNYAEACIGLGLAGGANADAEARSYINQVRARAFMPAISTSGAALMASLQHERKIEMAFEELRYFDIRRWMICDPAIYGDKAGYSNVKAINITYPYVPGTTYVKGTTYGTGTPTYSVSQLATRNWDNKSYFVPITLDEMNKNPKLIQNPGY